MSQTEHLANVISDCHKKQLVGHNKEKKKFRKGIFLKHMFAPVVYEQKPSHTIKFSFKIKKSEKI